MAGPLQTRLSFIGAKIQTTGFMITAINLVKNNKMKGKNGILLFVEFLKGLLEDRKWR